MKRTVTIYITDANSISIDQIDCLSFLNKKDKEDIFKYIPDETKKEKAISRYFLKKYIKNYTISKDGKPVYEDKFFNISHSFGKVVFALSSANIGIDIEKIRDAEPNLIDYVSNEEEKKYIDGDSTKFFEIWTSKESLVKCIGTGLENDLKNVPGLPINGQKRRKNQLFFVKSLKFEDFVISITLEGNEEFEIDFVEEKLEF